MRRVVNMLQSLSMIDNQSEISSERVYEFTGNPSPQFLDTIIDTLFNKNFNDSYEWIGSELKALGIAL